MKRVKTTLLLSAFVASACLYAGAQTVKEQPVKGSLALNISSGPAPLTVTITGPPEFLKPALAFPAGYTLGSPYSIDWGDGNRNPDHEKKFDGKHTYDAPGTYKIRAFLIKWNPEDSTTATWTATHDVTVGSAK